MKNHHTIVIVGGGNAGISVASQLLRKDAKLDIAIVDGTKKHYYQPAWTLVGGGEFDIKNTERDESSVIPEKAAWIQQMVAIFKPEENKISLVDGSDLSYDYLIVAPGIQLNWSEIKGLKENYLNFNKKINFNKKSKYKIKYSYIKLKNEELLKEFAKKFKIKASIARCFTFAGEYLPLTSQYVLGDIIKNILKNEDIRIKSNYKIIRSYMHSDDLVEWLLKIINNSNVDCPVYNVGSDDHISIHELATRLSKKYSLNIDFKDKILNKKKDIYVPNIEKAKNELNLVNNFNSLDAIFNTINILKKKHEKIN